MIEAANNLSPNIIKYVSVERISDEIKKAQKHAELFFTEAEVLGFLHEILPEVSNLKSKEKELWLAHIKNSEAKNEIVYFAAILIPIYLYKAESKAASLKMSRHTSKGIGILNKLVPQLDKEITPSKLRDIMVEAKDYFNDVKDFYCEVADNSIGAKATIEKISSFEDKVRESIQIPFINGEYLIKAGLKPSPVFKLILDDCGRLQAEGKSYSEVEEFAQLKIQSL